MSFLERIGQQIENDFALPQWEAVGAVAVYLVVGGVLALHIRFLYTRFSGAVADAEPVARVFPLLILVTTGVIAVVKNSLALSLGLVGALSIVRFRAAIKDPEELIYLFFCIGVGSCLGARQPVLALVLVAVATVFIIGLHFLIHRERRETVLLTITGTIEPYFTDPDEGILTTLGTLVPHYTVQRYDLEEGHGQIRVLLGRLTTRQTVQLIARLKSRFADCQISFVNVANTL